MIRAKGAEFTNRGEAAPFFAAKRPKLFYAPQRAHFFLPQGEVLPSPPFSFRRRSRHGASAPRRKCGVRRREPVCRATGVYSIKRGPRCAARSGEQRERAAGAVQERTRQGHRCPLSYTKHKWAPGPPQSRRFCGSAMRHRTAGRARFASAASAAQDGGSSRNGATRVHSIGVPAAHSAAGNGTMFPRKPLLPGQEISAPSLVPRHLRRGAKKRSMKDRFLLFLFYSTSPYLTLMRSSFSSRGSPPIQRKRAVAAPRTRSTGTPVR